MPTAATMTDRRTGRKPGQTDAEVRAARLEAFRLVASGECGVLEACRRAGISHRTWRRHRRRALETFA